MKEDLFNQIIEETTDREKYMAKFYPFYSIRQSLQVGKYKDLPSGTIIFSVLTYLLMEGKLKDKGVPYSDLEKFVGSLMNSLTEIEFTEEEIKEFTRYIFLKLTNDGSKFNYEYYDPATKSEKKVSVQYISSLLKSEHMCYITPEGIEFLLATKEVGEEHKISVYLLLLQKMMKNNDVDGVYKTISNLNTEIKKQIEQKQNLLEKLYYAPEDKYIEYLEYKDRSISILKDDEGMFEATKKQVSLYEKEILKNLSQKELEGEDKQVLIKTLKKINIELDRCISNYSALMKGTVNLINELPNIQQARLMRMFKETFSFEEKYNSMVKIDDMSLLKYLVEPMFKPYIRKQFSISKIDDMFSYKERKLAEDEREVNEEIEIGEVYTLDNEVDDRIEDNYTFYMRALLTLLSKNEKITLRDYISYLIENYGERTVMNKDVISFIYQLLPTKEGVKRLSYRELKQQIKLMNVDKVYVEVIEDLKLESFMENDIYAIPVSDPSDLVEVDDYMTIRNVKIGVN